MKEERQPKISIQEEDVGKQEEEICRKQNESNMKEILWWKCKDVRKECQQRKKNEENKKKEGSLGEDMIKLKNKQGKDDISDTVKENVDGELGEFWKVKSGTEIDGEKLVAPAVAETFDKTCIKLADNQSLTNLPGTSFTQCMPQGSSSNSSQASSPDRTEIYCSRPADQGRSATSSVHTQTEMFPLPYGGVQPISPPLYIHPPYFPYHPISHSVPPMVWRTSSPVNHNTSLIPKINAERFPLPLPPYIHPAYFPYHPLGVTPSMVWGTSSSGRHNASLIPSNNVNPTEIEKKKLDIKTNETQCMICKWVTYYDSLQCAILWTEQDLPILFIWHSSVLSNRKSLKDFLVSVDSEVQVETTQLKTSVNVLGYEVSHVALITWCGVVPENKDFLVRRAMQGFPILMSSNPLQFTSMGMNHFEESDNREQHVGECTEDFVIGKIVHFSECMALVRCNITNDKVANASFTLEDVEAEYRRVPGLELELENMFQVYGMIWKCDIKATNPWVCSKIWVTYKTLKVRPNDSQVPLAILNPINKAISCVKCHTLIIKESFGVLQSEEKLIFFTWNICKDFDCIEWKATSVTVQALVVKLKVCVEFLGHKIQWIALQVGLADTLTYEDAERTLDTLPWTVWSFFPLKLTHNRYTKANQHLSFPSSLVSRPVPQTEVSCTQISEGDTRSRANTQGYVHTLCRNSVILMCVMNSENILVQMTKGAVTINGNKCPPGKKFVTWIAEHKSLIFSCTVNKVKEFKVNGLKVSYCAVEAWNGFSEGEPKTVGHYCKIPYNLASCTSAANVEDVSENSFQQQDFELLSPIGTAEDEPDMVEIK
ncbi:uncharacterized protein LOC143017820 isoform X2 [Oratosquilla oratoria]|uniref:uncharacterized protein LOC143017820 isoform X2 n=1 Tax=Oratosquilla oratoria TaxID=337810 RepID=UPI003F76717B